MNTIGKELLDDIRNRLIDIYHPKLIYLFGSYAWGNPEADSDIDLFVVIDSSDLSMSERMRKGYAELSGFSVPFDLLVYTKAEFDAKRDHPSSLTYKIIRKGIVLYEAA